jgi:PIN domain nuclease of toxin-antitoxin system
MKILLDTHVFLWWVTDDSRLSLKAREVISNIENQRFLSAASGWEIAIKAKLGKISILENPKNFIYDQMEENKIQMLPVQMNHALQVYNLPDLHRDPFDRLLVAQCQMENLPIITSDPCIIKYNVTVVW